MPGRIIKRFDQLMEALEKEEYGTDKIEWFIKKNFAYTDGKSTDRVIDLIVGMIKTSRNIRRHLCKVRLRL